MLLIAVVTALLVAATILPWVPWPHGLIRTCDFPRLQIACLAAALMPVTLLLGSAGAAGATLLLMQGAVIVVQAAHCLPFTPLRPVQSPAHLGEIDHARVIRILSTNVKMSNRRFTALIELVRERQPDVLIVMECDDAWVEALQPLKDSWPHALEWPSDNTYGMMLLSKLPLVDPELRFVVLEDVPSIRTAVRLRNDDLVRLYAVHPEPPVPHVDTIGRDGELVRLAIEVNEDPLPVIVTGDLNDVAWSRTTRRFQRLTGLLDPRVGRGFFNTFDARFPFLRWPLDHLFHDPQFRFIGIERLRDIGSDHFPILFELSLAEHKRAHDAPDEPDGQDLAESRELVADSAELDREPVGSDWEKG